MKSCTKVRLVICTIRDMLGAFWRHRFVFVDVRIEAKERRIAESEKYIEACGMYLKHLGDS
jgi:hypothetical protein